MYGPTNNQNAMASYVFEKKRYISTKYMIEIQTANSLNFLKDIGPFKNKELKYLVNIN